MKKISYILTLLLLAIGVNWAKADDQTLALGNYAELLGGEDYDQCYDGTWYYSAPTQFYVGNTGSQIIYTKDQLADMAGKEIKSISFMYYNQGVYNPLPRTIKVWAQEIDEKEFAYNKEKAGYQYFEYSDATPVVASYDFEDDFLESFDAVSHELTINFDKPLAYSGNKNLLITITFEGSECDDGAESLMFYYNKDAKKLAMTACSDNVTFEQFHESTDWPYSSTKGTKLSHGTQLDQPLTKFTYQEGSKPVVKDATLSGVVKCGDTPVENATVRLSADGMNYDNFTDAEGKYTVTVPAENIGKNYTLTVTADGYDDYTAEGTFTFTSGEAKVQNIILKRTILPATLSGVVKCDETPVENATVRLSADGMNYDNFTDAEGKYTVTVPAENIGKNYTLTVTADGYDDYTAEGTFTFTSGEAKVQNIILKRTILPATLSGVVKCDETPVENATVRLSADGMNYDNFTDAEGKYTVTVPAENIGKNYTLTVTADGYEDYKYAQTLTFTSGEEKTQNINLTKKDNPSTMTGKVTANGEPVVGAEVKLAAKDNKYITYKTTTSEDGTYLLRVVKSEKTYTLTVTDGECEDYTEDNISFTPGETTIKDIAMTKTPDPENSVTLGKYNKMLKNGTGADGEVYYGHGFSWAAAPTNFSHQYTGSEIIYTKEQLQKMAGKAISQINFVFHNESAYETYPRTVKVWVKEIDNNAFDYDDKAGKYKFFDYDDASVAIANYEYDGELYNYAGENGEMELVFDKPLNYSGEKNLVVAITFEGENTCNVLDFNFYCNNDATKKAMTYFSDKYTFGDYADTEDWPYVNDDCVSELEQPVTRFFYTNATGINDITTGNKVAVKANDTTYNLAGQRVGRNYKGIVVSNGKKFMK